VLQPSSWIYDLSLIKPFKAAESDFWEMLLKVDCIL